MAVVVLVEEKNKRRDLKDFELIKARSEGFNEHLIQIWGFRIRYVGKEVSMDSIGSGMSSTTNIGTRSLYIDRITQNQSLVKVFDASGEAWLSVFNEQAEKIIGCSAMNLINSNPGREKEIFPIETEIGYMGTSSFPSRCY
ncbi:Replication protein A 70 kDa DNA-binding subunit B [Camellia lanceoleosa]|uniref:Replication protein A 70 kDa DNA-binding subunit B n=1 Tax=Camellia lanceoleosa TaxID=1840588 RepID=A0ACC0F4K4_9ERIC|nr:Replication protein A 70 kDa DNA-binding subunit B [Camellia lanceoleosa]